MTAHTRIFEYRDISGVIHLEKDEDDVLETPTEGDDITIKDRLYRVLIVSIQDDTSQNIAHVHRLSKTVVYVIAVR